MNPRIQLGLLATIVATVLLLSACSSRQTPDDGRPVVVATTGQIADTVAQVAGDRIHLTGLFGPGVDPHLYVPTEGDVATLASAQVIFYNGLHLEAQMIRALDQMARRGVTVVALGDRLDPEQLLAWDDSFPHDPHIWNDPMLWKEVTLLIRDTLIQADPDNEPGYRSNAEAYLKQIDETHSFVTEQIQRIPADRRVMITAHDAFGYFARTYGLEVRGLQGISTESEAGTNDVQSLAQFIVERQIPAVFVESSVPSDTIEAVQAAVQAQGFRVRIGGELYSDALGSPGTPEGTYLGMLRHNAQTLADALAQ